MPRGVSAAARLPFAVAGLGRRGFRGFHPMGADRHRLGIKLLAYARR